jgi:hypothetical protein
MKLRPRAHLARGRIILEEELMNRSALSLVLLAALLLGGCADNQVFEDRSDEVKIPHRIPSK